MKKFYIDSDFKCHTTNQDGIFREAEDDFFYGKCNLFIEGYRYKPAGETWVRDDGFPFDGGKMITPWKPYNELAAAQAQYERDMAEAAAAYQEGVDSAYDQ